MKEEDEVEDDNDEVEENMIFSSFILGGVCRVLLEG